MAAPTAIGARIRALRKSLSPESTQDQIGRAVGQYQVWYSRREKGEVEFTVSEAIAAAEALGCAAELVILPADRRDLLGLLGQVDAQDAALALRLLAILPRLEPMVRKMILGVVEIAEDQAADPALPERV